MPCVAIYPIRPTSEIAWLDCAAILSASARCVCCHRNQFLELESTISSSQAEHANSNALRPYKLASIRHVYDSAS